MVADNVKLSLPTLLHSIACKLITAEEFISWPWLTPLQRLDCRHHLSSDFACQNQRDTNMAQITAIFCSALIRGYWQCHCWYLTGSSWNVRVKAKCYYHYYSKMFVVLKSPTPGLLSATVTFTTWQTPWLKFSVGMQQPKWEATLHFYVWLYVQVWGNGCTPYLLTQHCVNL